MDIKLLDGIYEFMAKVYHGNWQYRFVDTPYMTKMNSGGKRESIIAHQWALMEFWFQIRRVCRNLNEAVDSIKLYEMIMNHDLGEIAKGDVPLVRQISGEGKDKHLIEHQEIKALTKSLDRETADKILDDFEEFETKPDEMESIEALVAKFLDYLGGNHFALVFGNNFTENSELIGKIVSTRWVLYTQELIKRLKKGNYVEAAEEVRKLAEHHVGEIVKAGIKFEFKGFE